MAVSKVRDCTCVQPATVLNHSHWEASFFPHAWTCDCSFLSFLWACLKGHWICVWQYCFRKCKTAIKTHLCLPFSSLDNPFNFAFLHVAYSMTSSSLWFVSVFWCIILLFFALFMKYQLESLWMLPFHVTRIKTAVKKDFQVTNTIQRESFPHPPTYPLPTTACMPTDTHKHEQIHWLGSSSFHGVSHTGTWQFVIQTVLGWGEEGIFICLCIHFSLTENED